MSRRDKGDTLRRAEIALNESFLVYADAELGRQVLETMESSRGGEVWSFRASCTTRTRNIQRPMCLLYRLSSTLQYRLSLFDSSLPRCSETSSTSSLRRSTLALKVDCLALRSVGRTQLLMRSVVVLGLNGRRHLEPQRRTSLQKAHACTVQACHGEITVKW